MTKLKLQQNMRAKVDPAFSVYIICIGNGLEQEDQTSHIRLPNILALKPTKIMPALYQLIEFVFPGLFTASFNLSSFTNSAILTPKNSAVDEINEVITSKFPGQEHTYLSFDDATDPAQQGLYVDFMNSLVPTGMPAHELVLKKEIPVLLLRNINPSKGLCNGTRLICKEFKKHLIAAQIIIGEKKGATIFIPRIPLQSSDPQQYPVQFTRRQFPIRPSMLRYDNKQGSRINTKQSWCILARASILSWSALCRIIAGNNSRKNKSIFEALRK